MQRNPESHKGENGNVVVIGGSTFQHGAPLMSALAAERSGIDLLFVSLPEIHQAAARVSSLNFQVHPFNGNEITEEDIETLLKLLATCDCAVIGPGIGREADQLRTLQTLIGSATCPLVLDASALQPWTMELIAERDAVLTPHLGELERMNLGTTDLAEIAKLHRCTIHVKGSIDHVFASDGTVEEIAGGNAGLTVGGTGDALAGLIAGLRAQGIPAAEACRMASTVIKRAGTLLYQTQGYAYRTIDVIELIPSILKIFLPNI